MNVNHKAKPVKNLDRATIHSFGDEWLNYDQSEITDEELSNLFHGYFCIFPWEDLPKKPEGFDMGCGSGRWAKIVARRVGRLNCIEPSITALDVARKNLSENTNCQFINSAADNDLPLGNGSQDFGYSLGVLHHIPDTLAALKICTALLKPGAPFLVYLYYRFDNRPLWFRLVWRLSELLRFTVSKLPSPIKSIMTDIIAVLIYWPLARLAWLIDKLGFDSAFIPLSFYRYSSLYTMRTDSRDRFGTPLEKRFTRQEIKAMMTGAGLENIKFSDQEPYWVAVGRKAQ